MDDKIKKWVDDAAKSGYSKEKIIQSLTNFGYSNEDIAILTKDLKETFSEKDSPKNEDQNKKSENLGFFKEIYKIILKPSEYFSNEEKDIKESLFYLTKISLISSLFIFILLISGYLIFKSFDILPIDFTKFISLKIILISLIIIPLILILGTIISSFVSAAVIYLTLILFKKDGKFSNIYFSYAVSLTPLLLLTIINIMPILGTLIYAVSGIYSLYILITGLSTLENISKIKAALIVLLPQLFLFMLFVPLIFIFKPSENIPLNLFSSFNTAESQTQVNFCNPIFIFIEKECSDNEKIILNIRNNGIAFSSFNYYINDKFANKEDLIFEPGKLHSLTLKLSLLEDKTAKNIFNDVKTIKIVPIANNIECANKAATSFNPLQAC